MKKLTQKDAYENVLKVRNKIFTLKFYKEKINIWEKENYMMKYRINEKFIDKIFKKFNKNNFRDVCIKVEVLDSMYATNLKEGIIDMINNIIKKCHRTDIKEGKISVVNNIKTVSSSNFEAKDCLSFASKYCSRLNSNKYPIYDSYVANMLCAINKIEKFYKNKITVSSMKNNYKKYKSVVTSFIKKFNESNSKEINYKEFDRYIWTWAKEIIYNMNRR